METVNLINILNQCIYLYQLSGIFYFLNRRNNIIVTILKMHNAIHSIVINNNGETSVYESNLLDENTLDYTSKLISSINDTIVDPTNTAVSKEIFDFLTKNPEKVIKEGSHFNLGDSSGFMLDIKQIITTFIKYKKLDYSYNELLELEKNDDLTFYEKTLLNDYKKLSEKELEEIIKYEIHNEMRNIEETLSYTLKNKEIVNEETFINMILEKIYEKGIDNISIYEKRYLELYNKKEEL